MYMDFIEKGSFHRNIVILYMTMVPQSEEINAINIELFIKDQWCEPYNPQQNSVESRGIKYVKEHVHALLDRVGAPDAALFHVHAVQYLAGIHYICQILVYLTK